MIIVAPIDLQQQQQVVEQTHHYIERACEIFGHRFAQIPVLFDLRGRSAGMYRVRNAQRQIRYNAHLFAKYFEDNLCVTVPHEVAHYVIDCLYGIRKVRPHGAEWKAVMREFGADASRTCRYDFSGTPVKSEKRYDYHCGCKTHQLTTRRHNKVLKSGIYYVCKSCNGKLTYSSRHVR
ncbi:MAG TPA: SprT-like domain-containing protein [Gammaproteobacteria bacterium]|nr:SprT-like domain-containing protein [Gammaproteobacteria bacterium]